MKTVPTLLALAVTGTIPALAAAQLVVGTSTRTETPYLIDLSTVRPTNQFPVPANIADSTQISALAGKSVWGMTANDPAQELYILDIGALVPGATPTANIFRMKYNNPTADLVGVVRDRGTGFEISMQGLAYDTQLNKLYGYYNVGGTPGEGIYEIDLANQVGLSLFADKVLATADLPGGETAWDISALDYDPVTNAIYGINDDGDAGAGLYKFNLANTSATQVVASPDYRRLERDFDGLATGGGHAYFFTDEPGFIYVYDLVNGGFTDFLSPVAGDSGLFGGAAYAPGLIPEPTSLVSCVFGSTLLLRRRKH